MQKYVIFISPNALNMMDSCAIKYVKALGMKAAVVVDDKAGCKLDIDEIIESDTDNADGIITDLVAFSGSHTIAGVLTYSDYHVEVTALVNEYFKLPGSSYSAALNCKNKYLCREALISDMWFQPKYAMLKNNDVASKKLDEINAPLIIKPINGLGSMYTRVLDSFDDIDNIFRLLKSEKESSQFGKERSINERWIAEQCLEGFQISVESYTKDSETTIVCIHDKLNPILQPLFRVFYSATPSARISAILEDEIMRTTRLMLEQIGFENGVCHTEFRISDSGQVQLLEINARPGGGLIIPSAYFSTGINLYTVAIDIALNREPQIPKQLSKNPIVFRVVYPEADGRLTRFDVSNEQLVDETVKVLETYSNIGDIVGEGQRLAMVLKQGEPGETIDRLVKDLDAIVSGWNIEIEPTKNEVPLPKHIVNSAHI